MTGLVITFIGILCLTVMKLRGKDHDTIVGSIYIVKEQLQDMYSDSMESLFDSKSPPGASDIAGLHVQSPFTLESSLPRTFTTGCGRG